jgi:acyl-coenzyme A synthetase/AMP-(fatty) acid ligase
MNITDPIRRLARVNPNAVAVIRADHSKVTYHEFDRLIDAASDICSVEGIAAGQTVGLSITGPDEFRGIVVALALARLGAVSADMALPAEHLDLCIVEPRSGAKRGVRSLAIEAIWTGMSEIGPDVPPARSHPGGAALCRIFASSGTTGVPKFVARSHALVTSRMRNRFLFLNGVPPVQICGMGLGSGWGYRVLLPTLWAGGSVVLTNPAQAVEAISRHQVTSIMIAPISLQRAVAARPEGAGPMPSLRSIVVGGSPMPAPLLTLVRQRLCDNVVSRYGSTETQDIAAAPFAAIAGRPRGVGYIYSNVEVEAVDDQDRKLPPGTEGILRIRSPYAVAGYFGDPAASASVFRDGWFYPGDIGAVMPDRLLTITGRVEEFINSGGNKVSPQLIEDVLLALPYVTEAAAFGVPDRLGVVRIWAAIVATQPIPQTVLDAACHEKLAEKAPKFIVQMEGLPRNENGKVVKDELIKYLTVHQP